MASNCHASDTCFTHEQEAFLTITHADFELSLEADTPAVEFPESYLDSITRALVMGWDITEETESHFQFWSQRPCDLATYWETEMARQAAREQRRTLEMEQQQDEEHPVEILDHQEQHLGEGEEEYSSEASVGEEVMEQVMELMKEEVGHLWDSEESDRAYELSNSMQEFLDAERWSENSRSIWIPEGGLVTYIPEDIQLSF